jgi:signal transduction histidine kinase
VEQARILVVSSDRVFVDALAQSWQRLRYSPEFMVASADAAAAFTRCAVVLTDDLAALPQLAAGVVLAIAVTAGGVDEAAIPETGGKLRVVRLARNLERNLERNMARNHVSGWDSGWGWAEYAAALAQETVLRLEAQAQVAEVKQRLRELERFAALGRFIVEARHGLGNALTGVLGHSELLLLEDEGMRREVRAQLETIHSMSLKMHETFHRLSSLEMELRVAERQAERETQRWPAQ